MWEKSRFFPLTAEQSTGKACTFTRRKRNWRSNRKEGNDSLTDISQQLALGKRQWHSLAWNRISFAYFQESVCFSLAGVFVLFSWGKGVFFLLLVKTTQSKILHIFSGQKEESVGLFFSMRNEWDNMINQTIAHTFPLTPSKPGGFFAGNNCMKPKPK